MPHGETQERKISHDSGICPAFLGNMRLQTQRQKHIFWINPGELASLKDDECFKLVHSRVVLRLAFSTETGAIKGPFSLPPQGI
jgi:hypothetical protein